MLSNHPSFKHVQSRGVLRETEEWFWSVTNDAPVLIWVSQGERETGSWTSFYPISLHVAAGECEPPVMGAGKGTTLTIDLPLTVMRRSTDTDVPGAHPLALPQQVKFSEQASISVSVERTNCKSQEQSANR